ncbi:MAG: carboxypeptidase regulatory-like domain-containing protein, partial [Bacteroidetes bacterium]|nr:carboxypeptidase regulatory-like domain-containing protein [Bacteroidota bacterium]
LDLSGYYLTEIQFLPSDQMDVTLKVWQGSFGNVTEIYSQDVDNFVLNEINSIELNFPLAIDITQDLWIGYNAVLEAGYFPLTTDSGPAVPFKGDLIRIQGEDWLSLSSDFFLDFNWVIRGFAEILADAQAPAAPSDLTVAAAPQGALGASLNWTNPSQTFGGDPLTQLDAIIIERNNQVITSISNPVIGGAGFYQDNSITSAGIYTFKIYGSNSFGNGILSAATIYVGEDIPVAPFNAQLIVNGNNGLVSWEAPSEGISGGYINPEAIVYSLKRFPENVIVAQNIAETSFVDDQISGVGTYFYSITSANGQGTGGTAVTNVAVLGAEGLLMYESFDYPYGQIPPGWTITGAQAGWSVSTTPYAGGTANELQLFWTPAASGLSRLVTYAISAGDLDFYRFRFKQRFDSYFGATDDEKIAIDISFDGGDTWNTLWESDLLQNIPAAEFQLPIVVPTAAQTIHLGFRFEGNTFNIDGWWLDDMIIEPVLDNDLAGLTIQGPQTIAEGFPSAFVVKIQNNGSLPQDNYSVKLMKNGNTELISLAGDLIAASEIKTFEFEWTPSASDVGSIPLSAYVAFDNDELPANNSTNTINTLVLQPGIFPISIGDGGNHVAGSPYDFFWDHSLTQTIYYPEEIGFPGGAIVALAYTNSFSAEANDVPLKIWLGETTNTDLANAWVDPASLQLVFDGEVDFPAGQNQILLNLDVPYIYTGSNLVVYSSKAYDIWASGKNFVNSFDTSRQRTRKAIRDYVPLDPANPPSPNSIWSLYPDVTIFLNLSGLATIQGVVSDGVNALEGAKVSLNNTNQTAFTNADGSYVFPTVLAGTYSVQFELFGYETFVVSDVVLAEDQSLELNASLTAIPQYNVTGTVQGNDGNLIEGATVKMDGYAGYEVLSDANGVFSFDAVYEGNYSLVINAFGYTPYALENIVINSNQNLGTIVLEEQIEAPFNLMVMNEGLEPGQALFSWNNPLTGWTESFESGSLPDEWSQIVTNTGSNAGLPATWTVSGPVTFYNSTIFPQDGDFQVFMMWDFSEQNEWLITKEFVVPAGNLQFWFYGVTGSNFGDNYYVKISTDAGQTWNILWNASDLPYGQNLYQEPVSIDLNMYAGQNARIAWHNEDGPSNFGMWYYWAIDNISIGDAAVNLSDLMTVSNPQNGKVNEAKPISVMAEMAPANRNRNLNGFNVYLDGTLMAEAVSETQFMFDGLADGQYTAGVQAVFTTGVSEIAEISFVVDDTRLLALVANPAGSGALLGSAWYQPGAEVLVKATAEEGFAFVNWTTSNGTVVSDLPTFFFTMPDNDVILVANFEVFQTFNLTFNIDMTGNEYFIPESTMVNITGSMHGWNVLGQMARDQALRRVENSMYYTITMALPPGEYAYAYFTDEGEDAIDWENIPSRTIDLNEDKVVYDSWGLILGVDKSMETVVTAGPNPFEDRILVSNTESVKRFEITNILGHKVMEAPLTGNVINTTDLLPGVYMIHFFGENGQSTIKKMIRK